MSSRDSLIRQVREWSDQHELLPHGGTLLAAVSGGADSMCMLHVLQELAPEYGFLLAAAHYHHGLRGEEADRDAAFVKEYCQHAGIPCYLEYGNVVEAAEERGLGVEEAGRLLRYDFLQRTANALGGAVIATAHNADDNAETLLLHLVRGTGLQGLTGIPPRRGNLIRPLLTCTREEISAYNQRNGVPHVEDSTNQDLNYSRNSIRHQVMPLLKAMNPRLSESVMRTTEALRRDNALLMRESMSILQYAECTESGVTVPISVLNALPEALRPRAVQILYQQLRPEEVLSAAHREAVLDLAANTAPSGFCMIPEGVAVRRDYDRLIFEERVTERLAAEPTDLPLPGTISWNGQIIRAEAIRYDGRPQKKDDFCIRTDEAVLLVRTRQTGDCLRPVGRPNKTVKKWMIDEKIPRLQREGLPVLTTRAGKLLGVIGLGVDQSAHPAPGEFAWHIAIQTQSVGKESKS